MNTIKSLSLAALLTFSLSASAIPFHIVKKDTALWIVFQDALVDPSHVVAFVETFLPEPNAAVVVKVTRGQASALIEFQNFFAVNAVETRAEAFMLKLQLFLEQKFPGTPVAADLYHAEAEVETDLADRITANNRIIYGCHK